MGLEDTVLEDLFLMSSSVLIVEYLLFALLARIC